VVGRWRGYLSGARCRLVYGPADATSTHSLASEKNQIGFTFLVLAHPGSLGQRAVKQVCGTVCVCVCMCVCVCGWITGSLLSLQNTVLIILKGCLLSLVEEEKQG